MPETYPEFFFEVTKTRILPYQERYGSQPFSPTLLIVPTGVGKTDAVPPLLRQIRYSVPKQAVSTDPPARLSPRRSPVEAVILGLDATVLPLVTTALEVAGQIRVRLMGAHKRRRNGDESAVSPLFSGKQPDGGKRLDHGHVYILPLGDADGHRINRVLIVSPLRPFLPDELDAVRGVRELWQRDGRPTVACVLTWQGERKDIPGSTHVTTVESTTPFVPPRHFRKGRNPRLFIEEEVRRECRNHGIPSQVLEIQESKLRSKFDVIEYRRNRKEDPVRPGYALRLTFAHPVPVPFAIGYGAHFGLGQFQAVE